MVDPAPYGRAERIFRVAAARLGGGTMNLRATDRAAILSMARSKFLDGLDRADRARSKVERANQQIFISLVLIDNARRRIAQRSRDNA